MKKIAPTLTRWVRVPFRSGPRTLAELMQAESELRALLAVARAARRWSTAPRLSDSLRFEHEMTRALARLDKVCGGGK